MLIHKGYVMKDSIVYIGRFQPFHNAHLATVQKACTMAKQVIIVIGSANQPRSISDPFTAEEREEFIKASCGDLAEKLTFVYVENLVYNDSQWAKQVAEKVDAAAINDKTNIGIIGYEKDESSFYLKMFPAWESIPMAQVEILDATTIRNIYFSEKCNLNFFHKVIPEGTVEWLRGFMEAPEYRDIIAEMRYIENYKKPYSGLPYAPTFNTGDAVVVKNNHVLLIRRRAFPGKGLLAIPGGFLNANTDKSLRDCAIRELYEETKIKVSRGRIASSIREEKVFDSINRSHRGRIITTAQFIVLDDVTVDSELPKVRGSDDAEKAVWVPFHKINRAEMFEDHYDIVSWFIGRL